MHLLYKRINNLNLPLDLQLKLFDNTILPIMTYSSEILGYENVQMFERIHTSFLRTITKCRKSTPLYMLYGELGRYPIEITKKSRIINFWTRIITGNQLKLVNILYQKLLHSNELFKWLNNVKSILRETGRNDLWENQSVNMHSGVHHCIKIYLKINSFRTANHYLPIETLHWQSIDVSERKCRLCNAQDIGDEFHYLFVCENFKDVRHQYMNTYYFKHPIF